MAQKVGSIYVDLVANTSQFISGMTKAGVTAKQVGNQIQNSFGKLGSLASTALAPFGQIGSTVANAFSGIGNAAGGALKSVSKMGGVLPAIGLGAAGAAAAAVTAFGALGVNAAKGAASFYDLSQSTGVSVEALSGLSFAAKQSGVEGEMLVKSLEKMNKAVVSAAQAPAGTKNAFTRLGVSVKDSTGQIRSSEAVFTDLAEKFAAMPDGAGKTALAMEVFGKSGAGLIPMLNEGKDGVQSLLDKAKELGITISGDTAAAADQFDDAMTEMKAAGDGLTNKLAADLLPAFNAVTKGILGGLAKQGSTWDWIVKVIGGAVKATITLLDTLVTAIGQVGQAFISMVRVIGYGEVAAWNAVKALATGNLSGAFDALKQFYEDAKREGKSFLTESGQLWKNFGQRVVETYSDIPQAEHKNRGKNSSVDLSGDSKTKKAKEDPTDSTLADLQQRLQASRELLAVSTEDELATKRAIAANKANAEILKLGEQLAKEKNIQTKNYASLVDDATQATIRNREAEIASNEIKAELNKTIATGTRQSSAAIAQANALTAAIKRGAEAVADANAYARAENELRDKGATQEQIAIRAGQVLNEEKARGQATTEQTIEDARFELEWQEKLNAALLQGAEAYRAVQLAKAKAEIDRTSNGTPDQKDELKRQAERKSELDRQAEEIEKQKQAAQKIQDTLQDAWQSFNDNLARILTGQKASWGEFFRGIAQNLAQSGLKQAQSTVLNALGIKSKVDGTSSNPFHVKVVNQLKPSAGLPDTPNTGADSASDADTRIDTPIKGITTKLTSVFSKIGTALSSIFKAISSTVGGVLGKVFGGFFAEGGYPDPYKISVVGERGPELFTPGVRGTITSNSDMRKMLSGNTATIYMDNRNANGADVEMRVHTAMSKYYDQVTMRTIVANREAQSRRPRSRF